MLTPFAVAVLKATLHQRGVLDQLKARVRAEIFSTLDDKVSASLAVSLCFCLPVIELHAHRLPPVYLDLSPSTSCPHLLLAHELAMGTVHSKARAEQCQPHPQRAHSRVLGV